MKPLTYRQLADALGLGSPDAARIRVKRHGLKTKMGKDGTVLVDVPDGYLGAPSRHRRKITPLDMLAATKAHVSDLQTALDRERRRADAAEADRRKLMAALIDALPKTKP